jgi:hypothetical protein
MKISLSYGFLETRVKVLGGSGIGGAPSVLLISALQSIIEVAVKSLQFINRHSPHDRIGKALQSDSLGGFFTFCVNPDSPVPGQRQVTVFL